MKTVIDAVNEFKGELSARECTESCDQIIVAMCDFYGYKLGDIDVGSGNRKDCSSYWKAIATFDEFNDLVSQMETNFGKCEESYKHYKEVFAACERLSKLGKDKELEVMDFYDLVDFDGYDYRAKNSTTFTNCTSYTAEKPKPVFTQEMCDNGELPQIGSKAQFIGNDDYLVEFNISDGDEVECICHTKDFEGESIGVYRHKDGYSVSILTQLIKPLTPPIELINGNPYQFRFAGDDVMYGIYNSHRNILSVEQGTYFDIARVYDIQPLTVEVK